MIHRSKILPLLAAAALAVWGCDDSGTVATSSATTDGCLALDQVTYLSGSEASQCCAGGSAISPAPTGCPAATAGTMATAGTLADGAATTAAGQSTAAVANSLTSGATQAKTSGLSGGNSLAATAGGLAPATALAGNGSLADSPSNAALSGSATGGSTGSGSGGSTSGLPTAADSATSAAPQVDGASGASGSSSSESVNILGLYSSGGSGMTRGGRGQGSGNADVGGFGQNGHSVTDLNQEDGRSPAGESTMGTADPADYFKRLGASDNIFKVVERRYVAKSKQWALADADAIARIGSTLGKKTAP